MQIDHTDKQELEEQRLALKVILHPAMTIEEKMDELWHLSDENLSALLKHCEEHEDFEICHAIKITMKEKEADRKANE